ncbi:MAG: hypothetical protein PHS53_00705 [Candidatus Pacebacteria bacterium]|nr:hypothetical protein [Candidatus Paceibacterota bacterium]MDD5356657.1 hypothetical protein [Candidatus Paceibacterota bacterium]
MNLAWLKQARNVLSLDYVEVCFVAGFNVLITLAMLAGRMKFLQSTSLLMGVAVIIATLAFILIERVSYKMTTREENTDIIMAIFFEAILLFGLPILPATASVLFLALQFLAVLGVQSLAIAFFWKAFNIEIAEIFVLVGLTGTIASERASHQLSYFTSGMKIIRARLGQLHILHALSAKKAKASP